MKAIVRAFLARTVMAALAVPLLTAGAVPATIGHAMTPAVESENQVDFFSDVQADATPAPPPTLPGCATSNPVGCFGADTIRTAYDIQPVLNRGITGLGRTIVVIDAFHSSTLGTDVAKFNTYWTLPDLTLITKAPFGVPPFDPTSKAQVSFWKETSIDVEWAHATAPRASIFVVEAKSEKDTDMLAATRWAVENNIGDVITMSFGEAETCADHSLLEQQHAVFEEAAERGISVFASSGDYGPARQSCDGNSLVFSVSTPASDPAVTGVGGTHLVAGTGGVYQSESAWNSSRGASGGGFSKVFHRPGYQARLSENKMRGVPDVAFDADFASGFLVVWNGRLGLAGGTSAGSPQWAGITALADQAAGHRIGSMNNVLYRIARSDAYHLAFHDITIGSNTFGGFMGYPAGPGWDAATGLGTPKVANLIRILRGRSDEEDGGDGEG